MAGILLVEDDSFIIDSLKEYLTGEGFQVASASGEQEAEAMLKSRSFELVLLDISLGDGSGFDVCRVAKQQKLPVIFLTASADENSIVRGLDMGADDYVSKPFRPRELVSRIRSVMRRYSDVTPVISVGDLLIDTEKGIVSRKATADKLEEIPLSALEYRLLMAFVSNRGRLLSRNKLLEDIWDIGGDFVNDNTLTVYIKRLREKIEADPQDPQIIKTVRGLGYRMD